MRICTMFCSVIEFYVCKDYRASNDILGVYGLNAIAVFVCFNHIYIFQLQGTRNEEY